ncbi:EpsG family protein [Psychrobacter sp. DM8]|uniref:EpsG family protein n=1 Tax=Psychrobacter sp. DM8 TaxID=3440636 RepID=UPI003F500BE8
MIPYLLVLSFVTFWIVLEQKALNRKSFWVPLIALTLFAGIRSFRVGTDSWNYTRDFREQLDVYNFKFEELVEPGYQVLEYALLSVTHSYFWLFISTAFIVVFCYLTIIRKYSVDYWFSVYLFITLGIYPFFFNGLRQGLAMAIFAFALPFLLDKRFIPYLLICLLAALFHTTALFMIPFYFLVHLNIAPLYKIILTFVGSFTISGILIAYIASTNARYEGYVETSDSAGGLFILGFYLALSLFTLFIIRLYKIKDESFITLFSFYAIGVAFMTPIAMLGANPSGPQRLLSYFTWTLVLILPVLFKKINNIYITGIGAGLFLIYFILTTSRFSNLTPYIINPFFEIF